MRSAGNYTRVPVILVNICPTAGFSEEGLIHLCDHTKCVLPPPDWYLKRKQAGLLADKEPSIPSAARQS